MSALWSRAARRSRRWGCLMSSNSNGWGPQILLCRMDTTDCQGHLHRDSLRLYQLRHLAQLRHASRVENAARQPHCHGCLRGSSAMARMATAAIKNGESYNAGISNVDEIANSHYSSGGADTGGFMPASISRKSFPLCRRWRRRPSISHIVRYKERWQMQNAYDTYNTTGSPCAPRVQD